MTPWPRIVISLWLVTLAGFAAAAEAPLSLEEYKARLEQYSTQIQGLAEHPEQAVDFYREVPSALQVQTPSGSMTVSVEFLHHGLEAFLKSSPTSKPAILSQLAGRLKAMHSEGDAFQQARAGDSASRERLNRILSAREFGRLRGPTELELLEARIGDWLNKKLNSLFPTAPDLDQLGQILVWAVIAIVSGMLAVWLYRKSRERLLSPPKEILPFVPSAKSWQTWLLEARHNASLGQWREAIRLGFWAAVSRLESEGVWRSDKARTPREYLNAIPAVNENKSSFAAVTKTFEVSWYGSRPVSAGDFERFVTELEKLGCRG
jgi:Domain of unknown function (DUF4129)